MLPGDVPARQQRLRRQRCRGREGRLGSADLGHFEFRRSVAAQIPHGTRRLSSASTRPPPSAPLSLSPAALSGRRAARHAAVTGRNQNNSTQQHLRRRTSRARRRFSHGGSSTEERGRHGARAARGPGAPHGFGTALKKAIRRRHCRGTLRLPLAFDYSSAWCNWAFAGLFFHRAVSFFFHRSFFSPFYFFSPI